MAATEAAATPSAEEILEREARTGPRAGLAALLAAVLAVATGIAPQAIYADSPRVYVLDAVRDAAGQDIGRPGLKTAEILFLNDKATALLLAAIGQALMTLLIGYVLLYLHDAATARGATTPRIARPLVLFGAIASAVANVGLQVAVMIRAHDFATSSDQSTQAAHDVLRAGGVLAFSAIGTFGSLAFAGGFVMVALAAMRIGLLTRFVGVLGAIAGVLVVLGPATGSSSFIVESFWLLMLGGLLLGRWPTGMPRAWTEGVAAPWPSQQEIREGRQRARAERAGGGSRAAADEPETGAPDPAAARRKKRKRR
jgi:hypothetical protein